MKKAIILIIIAVIIIGGACGFFIYKENSSYSLNVNKPISTSDPTTAPIKETAAVAGKNFSAQDIKNYYKLSQNVGDIGLPSAAMTTNLDAAKTIDGVQYYSTYSYDTRAAYNNDTSTPQNGNYSHVISNQVVSLAGQKISRDKFGKVDTSKLTNSQIEAQVYKIAAQYAEGYTANNPKLVVSANDNYEGNLNSVPEMNVSLNNPKQSEHGNLYKVEVNINGFKTPIYVGLDGYIFVNSQQDFYQLFFPNKVQ